jgi:KaiC/GvpD/RAD55 family RecA-like ATPase
LYDFLEAHVRQLYRLLGHGDINGCSDLRCILVDGVLLDNAIERFEKRTGHKPNEDELKRLKVVSRVIVKGEQAVVDWARKFNGHGNCFIGRASRKEDGSLHEFATVTCDLDPDRERGTAATVGQVQVSLLGAREILRRHPGGYLATSGNGALVIYRLSHSVTDSYEQFAMGFKTFEEELRKVLHEGVKLDATHDHARLVKLLGTMSTKGDTTEWRVSRFIDIPSLPYRRNKVLERIRACATGVDTQAPTQAVSNTVYASRSESDFALAVHYKKAGLSREDTLAALGKHVLGRNDRKDDHVRIVEKVFGSPEVLAVQEGLKVPLQYVTPNGSLDDHRARLLERSKYQNPEMPIGLAVIDKHTWGLRRGEIFTIAARPGVGKTSIAISIAARLAREGKRILFFTSEMSVDSTYDRLLQVLSGLPGDKFTTGTFTDDDRKRLDAAYEELKGFGIRLALCDACSPDIEQVKRVAREVKPDLLIYDHIQHIGGETDGARANVSKFVRGLKDISRELSCAVLALSQIRRLLKDLKTGKEVRPTLSDLKESGTIEEESGAVLLLSVLSEELDSPVRCLYSELAKNRYGPITVVGVEFDKFTAHFKDMEAIV